MSETAWNGYAAEREDARNATPHPTRRIGGQVVDADDVPDEEDA